MIYAEFNLNYFLVLTMFLLFNVTLSTQFYNSMQGSENDCISVLLLVSINSSQLSLCLEDYLKLINLFNHKQIVKFLF